MGEEAKRSPSYRDLIHAPSPSGAEAKATEVVADKMRDAGFDSSKVDRLNDAMGTLEGFGGGRSLLFNGQIDHIPEGDMEDPYSGRLMDGVPFGVDGEVVYGRAASDMKGSVAAMVMAGMILRELGVKFEGDFKIAAVAQEETGSTGTVATIEESRFLGYALVVGEATNIDIALGYRGGARADMVVKGRSCYASAPERGINALYKATDVISRIRSDLVPRLPEHPEFGKTSLAVTQIAVKPDTPNVVLEECSFHLDVRNTPNYLPEALKGDLEGLIASMREGDPELEAVLVPSRRAGSSRGFTGFYTDPEKHPVVGEAMNAVADVLGRNPAFKTWAFATDGRFYAWRGIPVIGFGPGEERFAHTHQDHVKVDDYLKSITAYAWLACKICRVR